MIRGIYKNSSAMQLLENKLEVTSNNMANASTTGFKSRQVVFQQLIDAEQAVRRNEIKVDLPEGQTPSYIDYKDGALQETGNKLDLAIQGEGFFAVSTENGEVYTRNGEFSINKDGMLVTAEGYNVLGESGPIEVNSDNFTVNQNGSILQDGLVVNRFQLKKFPSDEKVSMQGHFFKPHQAAEIQNAEPKVLQGYLEESNVNIIKQMTDLITTQRHFNTNNKAISSQDTALRKVVNEVGR